MGPHLGKIKNIEPEYFKLNWNILDMNKIKIDENRIPRWYFVVAKGMKRGNL
jgi:hypothetical protein